MNYHQSILVSIMFLARTCSYLAFFCLRPPRAKNPPAVWIANAAISGFPPQISVCIYHSQLVLCDAVIGQHARPRPKRLARFLLTFNGFITMELLLPPRKFRVIATFSTATPTQKILVGVIWGFWRVVTFEIKMTTLMAFEKSRKIQELKIRPKAPLSVKRKRLQQNEKNSG